MVRGAGNGPFGSGVAQQMRKPHGVRSDLPATQRDWNSEGGEHLISAVDQFAPPACWRLLTGREVHFRLMWLIPQKSREKSI